MLMWYHIYIAFLIHVSEICISKFIYLYDIFLVYINEILNMILLYQNYIPHNISITTLNVVHQYTFKYTKIMWSYKCDIFWLTFLIGRYEKKFNLLKILKNGYLSLDIQNEYWSYWSIVDVFVIFFLFFVFSIFFYFHIIFRTILSYFYKQVITIPEF